MNPQKLFTNNLSFLAVLWAIGVILISFAYLLLHKDLIFYNSVFWIGILLSGLVTYFIIIGESKPIIKLIFLFLFGFVLYLPHLLSSPDYFHFYDELTHYQPTLLIYETGSLNVNLTSFEVSKYYPGLEIVTVFIKNITGNSILVSGRLFIGIFHSFIVIFIFLFFREISSTKIAAIGAFAYFFNYSFTYFDTYFSYESAGLPLLILFLFVLSYKNVKTDPIKITFIQIILLGTIVITHHFSSYMLLLFLIILLIIKIIFDQIKIKNYDGKTHKLVFLAAVLIIGWILYVATVTLNYYNDMFGMVKDVLKLSLFDERTLDFFARSFLDFSYYELFIRRFLFIPLILAFVFLGIYYLYGGKNLRNENVLTLVLYSSLFLLSLLGSITLSVEFGRFGTFGFIGIALLIGVSLDRMQKNRLLKLVSLASVILLFIGAVSIGTNPPHRGAYSSDIYIGQQTVTGDVIFAADWSKQYSGRYNTMVSNIAVSNVFDSYGIQKSIFYGGWEVFFPSNITPEVLNYLKINKINYLVVDERISRFTSETHYFFERRELDMENHAPYGNTEPLPSESLSKFDRYSSFMKIYNNGHIKIYKYFF